jgi:ATP-binding cassette subfamily C (CFTR/MRP) protein 1
MASETETYMVSVERVESYSQVEQEAPAILPNNRPPRNYFFHIFATTKFIIIQVHWPKEGKIELKNVKLRYRPGLELVLKGVSLTIQPR